MNAVGASLMRGTTRAGRNSDPPALGCFRRSRQCNARFGGTLAPAIIVAPVIAIVITAGLVALAAEPTSWSVVDHSTNEVDRLRYTLERYKLHSGDYPFSLQDLLTPPPVPVSERWRGPYVKEFPRDAWGQDLRYRYPGVINGGSFHVISIGRDGVDGTADDIVSELMVFE